MSRAEFIFFLFGNSLLAAAVCFIAWGEANSRMGCILANVRGDPVAWVKPIISARY